MRRYAHFKCQEKPDTFKPTNLEESLDAWKEDWALFVSSWETKLGGSENAKARCWDGHSRSKLCVYFQLGRGS